MLVDSMFFITGGTCIFLVTVAVAGQPYLDILMIKDKLLPQVMKTVNISRHTNVSTSADIWMCCMQMWPMSWHVYSFEALACMAMAVIMQASKRRSLSRMTKAASVKRKSTAWCKKLKSMLSKTKRYAAVSVIPVLECTSSQRWQIPFPLFLALYKQDMLVLMS